MQPYVGYKGSAFNHIYKHRGYDDYKCEGDARGNPLRGCRRKDCSGPGRSAWAGPGWQPGPIDVLRHIYFGVTTGNLNKAMKRNIKRFPEKFCFQLTNEECSRFQIGILNGGRGSNLKYLLYVYTEQVRL